MPGPITSADMLEDVRSQIDEANTESITDQNIYAAMNRGQRRAANKLVKHFPDLFITFTTQTTYNSLDTYPVPVNSFGRRINHITIRRNTLEYPIKRVAFTDLHKFTSSAQVRVPSVYALKNRSYVVKPIPQDGVVLKIWYPAAPETIVKPLGRVVSVNTGSTYVLVEDLTTESTDLSTDVTSLKAFVNIVDCQTGYIKATLQLASVSTDDTPQLAFKTSGLGAATVYGRTVGTSLPSGDTDTTLNVNVNDYVCPVQGTCVPDLPDACLDFVVQWGVNDIKRRLGEAVADEKAMLDELEQDIKTQWAGREVRSRIANAATSWTR